MSSGPVVVCLGGAGDMGATLCRQLARSTRIGRVVVADFDGERADRVAARLRDDAHGGVSAVRVDVLDAAALKALLAEADFVVNAAGPFFRLAVPTLVSAIESGTPYLDICDDPEPTREMLGLDEAARAAGVGAVIGMGASPGLSNLLARRAADRLDRVIDCFTAWPLDTGGDADDEQALTQGAKGRGRPSAAAVHLMGQISGEIATVSEGKLVYGPPLAAVTLDFPGLGRGTAITVGGIPSPLPCSEAWGSRDARRT